MANHMWICPTKKQDEFYNIRKLMPLLKSEFPQFKFYYDEVTEEDNFYGGEYFITVAQKDIDYLFGMALWTNCSMVDKSEIIDELDKMGKEQLGDKLIDYIENGSANTEKCIEIRHTQFYKEIDVVTDWMRWYFGALIFDEGIYPIYVEPLKEKPNTQVPSPAQSFIKSFKTWLKS